MPEVNLNAKFARFTAKRLLDVSRYNTDAPGLILAMAERFADSDQREQIQAMRQAIRDDKPFGQLLKRGLRQVNARGQHHFFNTLVLSNLWRTEEAQRTAMLEYYGFIPPFTFLISPSMRCNMSCTGCYAGEYQIKDDLPMEVIERVINEAKEMGISFVTVLGGEPFIRRDMWDVYARHQDMYFMVFTNGTVLTQANVDRLAELGNVFVIISIEGSPEETDARRGPGTYDTIMDAFDQLREAGVLFGFSAMVTRHNVETICSNEFNQMLVDKGCLIGWHFLYMPVGNDPTPDLMPTPEQREYLRTHGAARIRAELPLFVMDFWNDAPYVGGCIAGGREYFHINTRGDVEPCIFTHFATDNIKEKSLAEVLNSPFFRAIRDRQPYSPNLLTPCMLIDHPHVFREICAQTYPVPTHPGAFTLTHELAPALDAHACQTCKIMEKSWQQDFIEQGFDHPQLHKTPEKVLEH